jgi:uncharacterized protein with HEPN domain
MMAKIEKNFIYRNYKLYLKDILDCIDKIIKYTKNGDLIPDDLTMDAVARNFEIIGIASSNIPNNIIDKYPMVEWDKLVNLSKLLYDYVNFNNIML